jgi:hypothetical protein
MDDADLALVLAVDGSASVTYEEFGLIAGGMAAALRDPAVTAGLTAGVRRGSLLSLLLWSGVGQQRVMLPWTRVATADDVHGFAQGVQDVPRVVQAGETAIGEALLACITLLSNMPANATRQVVDVIGDGRSNDGEPPGPIRDRMASAGITINGLCVLHEEPDLLQTYTAEVIGGPDAFALPCPDYPAFAEAMRRKLAREVGAPVV